MSTITPFREPKAFQMYTAGQSHAAGMDRADMQNAMMQRKLNEYDAGADLRAKDRESKSAELDQAQIMRDMQQAGAVLASFPEYDSPEGHQALLAQIPESVLDPEDSDIESIINSGGFGTWRANNLKQVEDYLTQMSKQYGAQSGQRKVRATKEGIHPETGRPALFNIYDDGSSELIEGVQPQVKLSSQMLKALDTAQNDAISAGQQADKALGLIDTIQANKDKFLAGKAQGWRENLKNISGQRDIVSQLRTQVIGLKNTDAIQNLPPGVASDKDIELVMRGVPPDDAPPEELIAFVRGVEKMERLKAQFSEFKANYISNSPTGDSRGLLKAWRESFDDSPSERPDPAGINQKQENDPLGLR